MINLYSDQTENVTHIQIGSTTPPLFCAYSVLIAGCINDLLIAMGQFEVTNQYNYNVGIGYKIVLATNPTYTDGIIIAKAVMTNLTPGTHHLACTPHGMIRLTDYVNRYVNLIIWASSNMAQYGDQLILEQNYGSISVAIMV